MTTKEQQDAWQAVCDEARDLGLVLVHFPDTALWTLPIPAPEWATVHIIRHNDPDKAIEVAKHVVKLRRNGEELTSAQMPTNE